LHIHGHGKECGSNRVDDVARVQIAAVRAPFDEHVGLVEYADVTWPGIDEVLIFRASGDAGDFDFVAANFFSNRADSGRINRKGVGSAACFTVSSRGVCGRTRRNQFGIVTC
jgi:hypothetical protein